MGNLCGPMHWHILLTTKTRSSRGRLHQKQLSFAAHLCCTSDNENIKCDTIAASLCAQHFTQSVHRVYQSKLPLQTSPILAVYCETEHLVAEGGQ